MSKYRLRPKIIQLLRHCFLNTKLLEQTKLKTSSNIGRDKSFVDDLNKERGIVRMRVAFVPRSAEIQPLFWRFVTFTPPKTLQQINNLLENGSHTPTPYSAQFLFIAIDNDSLRYRKL